MADFIYLLQNRLTPAQWRALEAIREAARAQGMPVFLVGGAVRDLTTGSPVRDLDFVLQGDADALLPDLQGAGATVAGRNAVMSSLYLTFRGGVRAELGTSVSVSYPKPGKPETHPAPILDDLRRRDFTANAMAVSLNEGSYGLLLDPLNGTADIENRELRLVSPYGFVEQPALLLRAARLGERLGWSLEERTESRYQTGKEENYIQALPPADRGYELEEIFHEEDPLGVLEHMEREGWRDVLFRALSSGGGDRAGLDHVRDLIGQLEAQGIHPDPSAVYFPLVTAKLDEKNRAALKELFARPGFAQQIDTIESRAKELGAQLTSKGSALPSESWRLLMGADPELVLWLAAHTRTGAVQTKIKAFLKDWPQMRQKIPYALMQEMRITPELPEYEKLIDELFFALIDGKLDTPEATRAFLEPYSPPAPPQISVRRRPAKSARGRKRVSEVAAPETTADLDISAIGESEPVGDEQTEPAQDTGAKAESTPEPEDRREKSLAAAPPARAAVVLAPTAEPMAVAASSKSTAPKKAAAHAATGPAAKLAKKAAAVKLPPAKASSQATRPGAKTSLKTASSRSAVTKNAAPLKATVKVVAKTAKKIPAKASVKAAPPTPTKSKGKPVKKTAAKVPPKKAASSKVAPKGTNKKVVLKKTAAKKVALAKQRTPVKAMKKAATKGGRR